MSSGSKQALMDELLRAGIPEIKLALGELIDRENARPLPPRYARLLPETLLVVTLRADAADALEPIAADLELELTDSCTRHGSLYDRAYRVRLQRSPDRDAPLYVVGTRAGRDIGGGAQGESPTGSSGGEGAPRAAVPSTLAAAGAASPATSSRASDSHTRIGHMPLTEGEVTRTPERSTSEWHSGRWLLVVEAGAGGEREVFRLTEPLVTVGRRTDDPELRASIAISDAPNVSRRQLALEWQERDGAPGFKVYNLGLNTVHLPGLDIPGSRAGRKSTNLDLVGEEFTGWVPPGVPMRIGDHGPTLRIEEVPPPPDEGDSDATVYE